MKTKEFCVVKIIIRADYEIPEGLSQKQRRAFFKKCRDKACWGTQFPKGAGGTLEVGRTRTRKFKSYC